MQQTIQFDLSPSARFDMRPAVRKLAAGWLLLALLALALSTVCALLLVAARTPLPGAIATSAAWFRSALVLHVTLAVVVWFLACAAGLWTLAGGVAGRWRWAALACAASGVAAMVAALLAGGAVPVLANYVPVLDSALFLIGLALFGAGIAACAISSLRGALRRLPGAGIEIWRLGAVLSIVIVIVALGALAAALTASDGVGAARFEEIAWGPGHILQFMHVVLLMSVWSILGERALGRPVAPRTWLIALLSLAAAPVLAAPAIYFAYPAGSPGLRHAFTLLMSWGSWPAAALLALGLQLQLLRAGRPALRSALPLVLSSLLFLLGCALGASIRGDSTMVPAHYHGTVGAVTLAYMALGYALLPSFGLPRLEGRMARWQPPLYGGGLMILASALAWSGWLGVPRKTLHADVIVQYPAYFAAMGLAGLGGLFAFSGAALFVLNIGRSLNQAWTGNARRKRWLYGAIAGTALAVGLAAQFGSPSTVMPGRQMRPDAVEHVALKRGEEVARRFSRGVTMLNERQYAGAASELHRVLELAPEMPEAHVNMGFAMIGLQRYPVAKSFFEVAIKLRANQANAYYGLALALQSSHDLPGAIGAMRSYIHMSQAGDPYLPKANAMISEWQKQ